MTDTELADASPSTEPRENLRGLGIFLIVSGGIALASALILTIEKIHLLENPGEALNCDISAFVSCGGVVNQPQASAFGFPNTLLGIVGFTLVVMVGVLLASGVRLPRWYWGGVIVGVTFGIGFVTWLQSQSIYVIQVLCPYCMVVWTMMIPIFVVAIGQAVRELRPESGVGRFLVEWRVLIIALWYVVVASLIWFQFGTTLWA
ncbi:vitamin K epoxide reductase family protein [Aeromicrobium alkaliterrae]|uniref:vitamin K epoxide reductase family protein n=1 Tax=Aeromicrobium alkaliterrae TaxID=302168 RepID=UPI0031E109F9